jgi:hypothetical protein
MSPFLNRGLPFGYIQYHFFIFEIIRVSYATVGGQHAHTDIYGAYGESPRIDAIFYGRHTGWCDRYGCMKRRGQTVPNAMATNHKML